MATAAKTTNSGIVTDDSGQRHIPESTRADGSTRRAIKIRPGYRPPEDVELYKNRTAEAFRNRGRGGGIPGAEGLKDDDKDTSLSVASMKNARRREARKKAKAVEEQAMAATSEKEDPAAAAGVANGDMKRGGETVDPEVEKEKKIRNLKKKLKQAKELEQKKEGGGSLLPEQIAKVIKITELIRELQSLGIDTDDDKKENGQGQAGEQKE